MSLEIPEHLPLEMQDIQILRCQMCGAIVPGMWRVSRETMRHAIDHMLDRHLDALVTGRWSNPAFIDCAIQDPFWFDEHAPGEAR